MSANQGVAQIAQITAVFIELMTGKKDEERVERVSAYAAEGG